MNLPERGPGQLRLGVAIEVPEPYASELQDARRRFGDPLADAIPPHVTVLGPTVVDVESVGAVHEHLARVGSVVGPFTVHLRGTATFRPVSPVVFVQVVEGLAGCERLEALVRDGLLAQDLRFNYHPHVTVAHEVPDDALDRAFAEMAPFEARFEVAALHLYEHGDDSVWRPVQAFGLAGEPLEG